MLIPGQNLDTMRYEDMIRSKTTSKAYVKIDSFYMYRTEISNAFYRYYLDQLLFVNKDTAAYLAAFPDTTVWRMDMAYNEPYVLYYFRHPAYRDFPVVGVSWEQANAFCAWLTKTYNADPKRKFKNARFDLPSKHEWMAAANGGMQYMTFAWGGPRLRNSQGQALANYREIEQTAIVRDTIEGTPVYSTRRGAEHVGEAGMLNDAGDITAPVFSYWPNNYGLYNMCGNVEELVREKGLSKGGSWHDTGYYLQNRVEERYTDSASAERGFRVMMHIR